MGTAERMQAAAARKTVLRTAAIRIIHLTIVGCLLLVGGCGSSARDVVTEIQQLGGGVSLDEKGRVTFVNLSGTKVRDEQLAILARLPHLRKVWLHAAPIGDAGLAHLRELEHLEQVVLSQTKVTDRGLDVLKERKTLREVYLSETAVTEQGAQALSDALEGRAQIIL